MHLFVDADAMPVPAKEVIFKLAKRLQIHTTLVANQGMYTPKGDLVKMQVVEAGPDQADDWIVESCRTDDVVITADIPLADRVVTKGALAITPRGDLLNSQNIKQRLATRDLLDQLRSSGEITGGPPAYSDRDRQTFTNQLDKIITRQLRKQA